MLRQSVAWALSHTAQVGARDAYFWNKGTDQLPTLRDASHKTLTG